MRRKNKATLAPTQPNSCTTGRSAPQTHAGGSAAEVQVHTTPPHLRSRGEPGRLQLQDAISVHCPAVLRDARGAIHSPHTLTQRVQQRHKHTPQPKLPHCPGMLQLQPRTKHTQSNQRKQSTSPPPQGVCAHLEQKAVHDVRVHVFIQLKRFLPRLSPPPTHIHTRYCTKQHYPPSALPVVKATRNGSKPGKTREARARNGAHSQARRIWAPLWCAACPPQSPAHFG